MPLYKSLVSNKMVKSEILAKHPLLKSFSPHYCPYTLEDLKEFLTRFPFVFCKPCRSSQGKGVFSILKKQEGLYTLNYRHLTYVGLSFEALSKLAAVIINESPYIIQQGIVTPQFKGNVFDIRIIVQRPKEKWEVTGIAARVAKDNFLTTNISAGGKGYALETVLEELGATPKVQSSIKEILVFISLEAMNAMEHHFPHLCQIGVDVALDNQFRPWILEINSAPKFEVFTHFDMDLYKQIARNHIKSKKRKLTFNSPFAHL
ncbi:YheC/YheD family protein [Proteinivorax hydrogeniformans]|uniref:YheC/YheD family protein n=1 Tax=Proteinivorax hydrogeniformans TaxID=1826727 RepID=A0AAU8HV57_9FIRM